MKVGTVVSSFFVLVVGLGVARYAHAGFPAPALWATYPNYNQGDNRPSGKELCLNTPANMPPGRQFACEIKPLVHVSTGVYEIKLTNGAPLPVAGSPGRGNDSGYAVFVTAVGSNARCTERLFTVSGNDVTSTVHCVTPAGVFVDSNFSWTYRTDSAGYEQRAPQPQNLIYTRVRATTPPTIMDGETYNPFPELISVTRAGTGAYHVTFANVNGQSSNMDIEPTTGMNNVIVERTCTNAGTTACKRAVCVPSSWTNNGGGPGANLDVDVRCFSNGQAIDVDFRVLVANEAHNSQMTGSGNDEGLGARFGWANAPTLSLNQCVTTLAEYKHRNQHETPSGNWPTNPQELCRTGTGTWRVTFKNASFYHTNDVSALVASRSTTGGYCNVAKIDCGNVTCSGPATVDVKCYDSAGSLTNTRWNLSILY